MYKFGEAAAAAGITEAQLRNWTARYDDLWLPSEREPGKWREFSKRDCLVLAFVKELVSLGATVPQASDAGSVFLAIYGCAAFQPLEEDTFKGPETVWLLRRTDGTWDVWESYAKARQRAIVAGLFSVIALDGQRLVDKVIFRLECIQK